MISEKKLKEVLLSLSFWALESSPDVRKSMDKKIEGVFKNGIV